MRVLDVCAGTGSATKAFADNGCDRRRVESAPDLESEYTADVRQVAKNPRRFFGDWMPDVIWASPPCTKFSMAGSGSKQKGSKSWAYDGPYQFYGPRFPQDRSAREACAIVLACLRIIESYPNAYWWMENPQGGLKTMGFMQRLGVPATVTYCQYGDRRMKPYEPLGKVAGDMEAEASLLQRRPMPRISTTRFADGDTRARRRTGTRESPIRAIAGDLCGD